MGKGEGQTEANDVKKVILELRLDEEGIAQFASNLEELMESSVELADEIKELVTEDIIQSESDLLALFGITDEPRLAPTYILWYVDCQLPYPKACKRAKAEAKRLAKHLGTKVTAIALHDGSHTRLEAVYK
tara:strand:+ start:4885 stop:5277 length:393 start_codon:yes stop_codon:yes gene_type:complete